MRNRKILKVKVVSSSFVDDFERNINRTIDELESLGREVSSLDVVSKEGRLVGVIQYKEYLDDLENLPDVIDF